MSRICWGTRSCWRSPVWPGGLHLPWCDLSGSHQRLRAVSYCWAGLGGSGLRQTWVLRAFLSHSRVPATQSSSSSWSFRRRAAWSQHSKPIDRHVPWRTLDCEGALSQSLFCLWTDHQGRSVLCLSCQEWLQTVAGTCMCPEVKEVGCSCSSNLSDQWSLICPCSFSHGSTCRFSEVTYSSCRGLGKSSVES